MYYRPNVNVRIDASCSCSKMPVCVCVCVRVCVCVCVCVRVHVCFMVMELHLNFRSNFITHLDQISIINRGAIFVINRAFAFDAILKVEFGSNFINSAR